MIGVFQKWKDQIGDWYLTSSKTARKGPTRKIFIKIVAERQFILQKQNRTDKVFLFWTEFHTVQLETVSILTFESLKDN